MTSRIFLLPTTWIHHQLQLIDVKSRAVIRMWSRDSEYLITMWWNKHYQVSGFATMKKQNSTHTSRMKFHGLDKIYTIIYLACFKLLKIELSFKNRMVPPTAFGFLWSISRRYLRLTVHKMIIIFCEVY